MKKITLIAFFAFWINISFSQTIYSNYLDMTSEWRYYSNGFGYTNYSTVYFDGYETINDKIYYKQYRKTLANTNYTGTITSTLTLSGPSYIREDATGKFYIYDSTINDEDVYLDNQQILNSEIGDTFPEFASSCNIESFETNYFGLMPLKRVKGSINCTNCGVIEGIGKVGPTCALGIEGNTWLKCYSKGSNEILFGTIMDCNLFPIPIRVNLGINLNEITVNDFIVFPNPAKDYISFKSKLPSEENTFEIYNIIGTKVKNGQIESDEQKVDISSLPNGVYLIKVTENTSDKIIKLIKE